MWYCTRKKIREFSSPICYLDLQCHFLWNKKTLILSRKMDEPWKKGIKQSKVPGPPWVKCDGWSMDECYRLLLPCWIGQASGFPKKWKNIHLISRSSDQGIPPTYHHTSRKEIQRQTSKRKHKIEKHGANNNWYMIYVCVHNIVFSRCFLLIKLCCSNMIKYVSHI